MPYHPPKGSVRMNLNVDENLHYAFKLAVISERKNMTTVLNELIRKYIAQHPPTMAVKKKKAR